MNELIQELVEQADSTIYDQLDSNALDPFVQKFAELIIRECISACRNHRDVERFGIYPARVAMVTEACVDNIKEHFGVEE
jgi:uncharacterized protein (DUF924 family)